MKKIFGVLAFVCLVLMMGAANSMYLEIITPFGCVLRFLVCFCVMVPCLWLSGVFSEIDGR